MTALAGIKVIEMGGIGPTPFAAMLLADMGAEVIRIDRQSLENANPSEVMLRGRRNLAVNLKSGQGVDVVKKLLKTADVLIEGYRPGVMEKLGLSPDTCLKINPALIYGRMTGWGQNGPLAQMAGHDINYIAISGALASIGKKDSGPVLPLNLVGDFGGGGLYLVMGVLAALLSAKNTGKGQVVDAAISDGAASLMTMIHGYQTMGMWQEGRQSNILDGGAHFYDSYECADGKWVAIGAIELHFYIELLDKLGLTEEVGQVTYPDQFDEKVWQRMRPVFTAKFKEKTQAQWCEVFEGSDACFSPVLEINESFEYPHNVARDLFVDIDGVKQTGPVPKFVGTPSTVKHGPKPAGCDSDAILKELGFCEAEIQQYHDMGILT